MRGEGGNGITPCMSLVLHLTTPFSSRPTGHTLFTRHFILYTRKGRCFFFVFHIEGKTIIVRYSADLRLIIFEIDEVISNNIIDAQERCLPLLVLIIRLIRR